MILCAFFPAGAAAGIAITYPADGAYVDGGVFTPPRDVDLANNTVIVNSGTITNGVYGGWSTGGGSVSGNSIVINGGTVQGTSQGGYSPSGGGAVSGNSVTINGGTVSTAQGGGAGSGSTTGNSVIVNGGTVDYVSGGFSLAGIASGNSVILRGGRINGAVVGGITGTGSAVNNTVTILGSPTLADAMVWGGSGMGADLRTGNTLNLHSAVTIDHIDNFENYNFYLPSTLAAGQTMLAVTSVASLGDNATVNVGFEDGFSPLQQGDQVVLIDAGTLTGTLANTTANGRARQGVTLLYDFDLLMENNQLLATLASIGINPQTKSLSEGRVAGYAFVNQGSDLIIGPGMSSAVAATQGGLAPFGAASGGWSRYNTGSHVDVSGFSLMAGLGWGQPVNDKGSSLLAGAFVEAGWGGYDAYNSFSNAASVRGDGNTNYYGGGVLARYGAPCGGYFDASFRAGRVATDFASSDLRDGMGNGANYDSGSAYYGAHAGLGYVWNITDKASLDMSTRYIWTHQNSDTVNVLGDPITFDSADSQRWRTGAHFVYALNESIAPYAGAYYDHEFDGKARATTYGFAIDAPSLQGGTGVGELGLAIKPVAGSAFSLDLGAQGYMGVREGVSGSLQLKFAF